MEHINNDHNNRYYPFYTTRTHYKCKNRTRQLQKQIEYLQNKLNEKQ